MDIKTVSPEPLTESGKNQQSLKVASKTADKKNAAVKKAAREFEALFTGMMLKSMRETVGKDELTGGGDGEDIYRSLLDQEYARLSSERGGLGLARMIEKQLMETNSAAVQLPGADKDIALSAAENGLASMPVQPGAHEDNGETR